jgi:hypothetical protein
LDISSSQKYQNSIGYGIRIQDDNG